MAAGGWIGRSAVLLVPLAAWPAAAGAQLVSEDSRGSQRICTYYGSETLPNDEVVARSVTVGLGQSCPATAPHRDPNAPVPPNARLLGDSTTNGSRICRYEEGGVEYQQSISIDALCAMTPALNNRR